MEYASKDNESTVRTDKRKRNHKGEIPFINNRSEFATQAKFIKAIQRVPDNISARVIQRDLIGTTEAPIGFRSTDDDRRTIHIHPMPPTRHVYPDEMNRTRVGERPQRGRDTNPLLKHYMVVKNGTSYQLPVKHFFEPGYDRSSQSWIPNPPRGKSGARSHQPEGFGGNQDWTPALVHENEINMRHSRKATLQHEYREEARKTVIPDLTMENSKFFTSPWAVGTMSIVSTPQDLDFGTPEQRGREGVELPREGYTPSPAGTVPERGMAEMAGTITIDCANLVAGINTVPAQRVAEIERLEIEIGRKIIAQRNALLQASGVPRRVIAGMPSPFVRQAGILSHLVTMIAEDLIRNREMVEMVEMIEEIPPSHPEIAPSAEAAEDEATATDLMGPD